MSFICEYCGHEYKKKHNLTKHISNKHSKSKATCSFCNSKFSYFRELDYHIKSEHNIIIEVEDLCFENHKDFNQCKDNETELQIYPTENQRLRALQLPEVYKGHDPKIKSDICKICIREESTCHDSMTSNNLCTDIHTINIQKNGNYCDKRIYEFDKSEEDAIIESLMTEDYISETITISDRELDHNILVDKCDKIYDMIKKNGLSNVSKGSKVIIKNHINKMLNLVNKYDSKRTR